jgi:hypothetical protein
MTAVPEPALATAQPSQARFPFDPLPVIARNAQQSADALDHDAPRFVDRRSDQSDARSRTGIRQAMDPFRPCPRLSEPASRHHQPDAPARLIGRQLVAMRPKFEPRVQRREVRRSHRQDDPALLVRIGIAQPVEQLARAIPIHVSSAVSCSWRCFRR